MESTAHLSILDPNHPVLSQEYAVYTPAIDEMVTTLGDWIDQRITGGYIYGPSRYGKSRAVKWYVRAELEARVRRCMPLVVWIRPGGKIIETDFWNQLLAASEFHFYNPLHRKRSPIARFLFKQQLITLARAARQNFVLLIIDEAHEVTLTEWKWLLGIQNDLDDEGYRFSVFSIGSHQIAFQPDYIARTGNAHIAVRFFASDARFRGVMNVDELKYVLNGYDEDSEWPSRSGSSYLKYFAPEDFAQGRRLTNHAEELWNAITEQYPPEFVKRNKKCPTGVPMRTIAHSAEKLLRQLAEGHKWDEVFSPNNLGSVVISTGLYDHLRRISVIE
jgi:hypothetical protein